MRAAIKTLADVVLIGFGVLLLVLLVGVIVYFRPTVEMSGSGGIGAVSAGAGLVVILIVLCIGFAGVIRLVYLVGRSLLHAASPVLQRPRKDQHDQPRHG
jgi:hypothetical protein